jgi:hypothetical protein
MRRQRSHGASLPCPRRTAGLVAAVNYDLGDGFA